MPTRVCCLAGTPYLAHHIVRILNTKGFDKASISVLFPDKQDTENFAAIMHTHMPKPGSERVKTGGMLSGPLGWAMGLGALGWVVGIGALIIPGIGPIIAIGPMLAALSAPVIGAAVGGVVGGLVGMGLSEIEAKDYENRIRAGAIFISIEARGTEEIARIDEALGRAGAEHISHAASGSAVKVSA